jgi:hypothetical protein
MAAVTIILTTLEKKGKGSLERMDGLGDVVLDALKIFKTINLDDTGCILLLLNRHDFHKYAYINSTH